MAGGTGYPGPISFGKGARTFVRAFAFIDVFMVTMRIKRARVNSAKAAFDLIGGLPVSR
jgi:hypothetical protein